MPIVNARIASTMLGIEDHGIMTFMLQLDFGDAMQGFGGYALDHPHCVSRERVGNAARYQLAIRGVLEVVGVDRWEKLPGCYVRVDRGPGDHVARIGNVIKDRWLDVNALSAAGLTT